MEVSGEFHPPSALSSGKEPGYQFSKGLAGSQNRSGRSGEGNKIPLLSLPAGID